MFSIFYLTINFQFPFLRLYFVDFILSTLLERQAYLKSGLAQAMADEKWHCRHPLTELQVDQRMKMMIIIIIISVVFVICIIDFN